jgi:hypothetical protein
VLENLRSGDVSTSLDMTVLALETSCDETGVAILRRHNGDSASDLLASEVASQIAAHEKYGGIVPEIASRNHLVYAPRLLDRAASTADIGLSEIDAFAATSLANLILLSIISKDICSRLFSEMTSASCRSRGRRLEVDATFRSL